MIKFKKIFGKKSTLLGTILIILNLALLFNTNLMKINLDNNDDEYIYNRQALNSASISNYKFYKNITILSSQVSGSGSHSNFPVLISLIDSDLHDQCQVNGDDIAFYRGKNLLDYEIEYFKRDYTFTSAKLVAWVRIPSLSTSINTVIQMYYANPSLIGSETNPSGVWINNFQGVWHLGESSGSMSRDSTSNGFLGTHVGGPTSQEGKIGNAYYFDGDDQIITSAHASDLDINGNKPRTITFWIKQNENFTNWGEVFCLGSGGIFNLFGFNTHVNNDQWVIVLGGEVIQNAKFVPTIPGSHGSWIHHALVYVGGRELLYYVNGGLLHNYTIGSQPTHQLSTGDDIAFRLGAGYNFTGLIDETHVSSTYYSADWIATEFNNQDDPSSFYSVGNVEINSDYVPMLPSNVLTFSIIIFIAIGAFVSTAIFGSIKNTSKNKNKLKNKSSKSSPYWVKNYVKEHGKDPYRPSQHPKYKNTPPPRNRSAY